MRKTPLGVRGCLGEKCDLASDPRNFSDLSRMGNLRIWVDASGRTKVVTFSGDFGGADQFCCFECSCK